MLPSLGSGGTCVCVVQYLFAAWRFERVADSAPTNRAPVVNDLITCVRLCFESEHRVIAATSRRLCCDDNCRNWGPHSS